MLTKKKLKENDVKLTREEIAVRAMEIAKMCADGSYKNAVACIGRMVALSKAINDGYWEEKMLIGHECEAGYLLYECDKRKNMVLD